MFLEKFELRLVKIDDKPIDEDEQTHFTFWYSGKIERHDHGKEQSVKKDEVERLCAMLACHYGITPEEFKAALEVEQKERGKKEPTGKP